MEERKEGDERTRFEKLICDILDCNREAEWSHFAEGMVIKICDEHQKGYQLQSILHNLEYNPTSLSLEEMRHVLKQDILDKLLDNYAIRYEKQEEEMRAAMQAEDEEEE